MNEDSMTLVVERVGDRLEPDVAGLVARGAARGRTRRRRHRAGLAVTGVATAAAVAAVAAVLVPQPAARSGHVAAGDPGPTPRQVAVAAEDMSATLAALLPGAKPAEDNEIDIYQIQRGTVRWSGSLVSLTIDSRGVGTTTPARERCETLLGSPCSAAPGGAWVGEEGAITVDVPSGEVQTSWDVVRVYVPDGHVIEARGERGSAEAVDRGEGSMADRELLRSLVLDDVWLS